VRLAAILLALPLWGQVRLIATPEPMAVMESLGMRSLGLWTVSLCSESPAPVVVPRERLVLALPTVRIVPNDRARAALQYAQERTWQARTAGVMKYILLGATGATALAKTNPNVVAGLAVGTGVAMEVARRLEGDTPVLTPWLAGLDDGPLVLGPGQCGSRTVFAAKQPNVKVVEAVIR